MNDMKKKWKEKLQEPKLLFSLFLFEKNEKLGGRTREKDWKKRLEKVLRNWLMVVRGQYLIWDGSRSFRVEIE